MSWMEYASFLATFPPIMSAIKIAGNGDGMRVQLDIPESEMAEAIKLLQWREVVLKVDIMPEKQDSNRNGKMAKRAERKSTWTPAESPDTD